MRYSTEPRFRKYVKGYRFLSFTRKFGNKRGKKINGYCNKKRDRCCKYCFKKSSPKNCRSNRTFDGNKIAGKINSIDKPKEKKKKKQKKQKKFTFHQKKDNKLLTILNCFEHKM